MSYYFLIHVLTYQEKLGDLLNALSDRLLGLGLAALLLSVVCNSTRTPSQS